MNLTSLPLPELTDEHYFDLKGTLERLSYGEAVQFPPMELVQFNRRGQTIRFCLNMVQDPVQEQLRKGKFYEQPDLSVLEKWVRKGAHIIDVGANIGNHTVYFATQMEALRVVPVEPNPLALAPLVASLEVNNLFEQVCVDFLGFGLSDQAAGGYGMKRHDKNLGATKMRPGEGQIQAFRGDDVLADETPDLIKIDVEGMEIEVLLGLEALIVQHRPVLMVEVLNEKKSLFDVWLEAAEYRIVHSSKVGPKNANYIVVSDLAGGDV